MPKAFFQYRTDDETETYSFLQDIGIAGALGNLAAVVGTPRLPHKFKPRRVSLRSGPPFVYRHYVVGGTFLTAGLPLGTVVGALGPATVVGQDGEVNNG